MKKIMLVLLCILVIGCAQDQLPPEPGEFTGTPIGKATTALPSWASSPSAGFTISNKEILATPDIKSFDQIVKVAGETYVYRIGYEYVNNQWSKFEFNGNVVPGSNWIKGNADMSFSALVDTYLGDNPIIAYACTYNNGWDCHNNKWMMHVYNVKRVDCISGVKCDENILMKCVDYKWLISQKCTDMEKCDAAKVKCDPILPDAPPAVDVPSTTDLEVCDILQEGETKTFTINNKDYEITNKLITTPITVPLFGTEYVKFKVNGEITDILKDNDLYTLNDGTLIEIKDIVFKEIGISTVNYYLETNDNRITVDEHKEKETNNINFEGKLFTIEVLLINRLYNITGKPETKFTINGEVTDLMDEGDSYIIVDGSTFSIKNIVYNEPGDVPSNVNFCLTSKTIVEEPEAPDLATGRTYLIANETKIDLTYDSKHWMTKGESILLKNPATNSEWDVHLLQITDAGCLLWVGGNSARVPPGAGFYLATMRTQVITQETDRCEVLFGSTGINFQGLTLYGDFNSLTLAKDESIKWTHDGKAIMMMTLLDAYLDTCRIGLGADKYPEMILLKNKQETVGYMGITAILPYDNVDSKACTFSIKDLS